MRKLFNDEAGFVVSAELVLVMTIAVLAMAVGLASVRDSITAELVDVSNAFGTIDQSFNYNGITKAAGGGGTVAHGVAAGAGFQDRVDDCDCTRFATSTVTGKPDGTGTTNENL